MNDCVLTPLFRTVEAVEPSVTRCVDTTARLNDDGAADGGDPDRLH